MDIVKSEVITVASCSPPSKPKLKEPQKNPRKGVRFHGHEKWSPVPEANATAPFQSGGNRIWRFKNIAFPWLPKPSKRAASDENRKQKQSKMVRIQGSRVLRTHSAPKSLGGEFRERQLLSKTFNTSHVKNCNGAANECQKTEKDDETNLSSELDPRKRRISLPDFGKDGIREKAVIEELLREQCSITLKIDQKTFSPSQTVNTEKVKDNHFNVKKNLKENANRKFSAGDLNTKKRSEIVAYAKQRSRSFELPKVKKRDEDSNSPTNDPLEQKLNQNGPFKASSKQLRAKKITNPDVYFVPIPGEESVDSFNNDEDHDDENEDRLSSSDSEPSLAHLSHSEIDLPADILPFNITIQEILRNELREQLETREFCVEMCQDWCREICQAVKQKVQDLRSDTYKVVCVMYIGALRGHGVHASVQSLWSPRQDNFTAVIYKNSSLFAVASVLAMKFE